MTTFPSLTNQPTIEGFYNPLGAIFSKKWPKNVEFRPDLFTLNPFWAFNFTFQPKLMVLMESWVFFELIFPRTKIQATFFGQKFLC